MNSLTKINSHGIPDAPKDAVAYWDWVASQFARGSVASQIMCGFALIELKKEMGVKQGARLDVAHNFPNDFGKSPHNLPNEFGKLTWPEFIEKTYGFSDDTARNRIKMAEGVRAKFKKMELAERFKALLQTPISEWSEPDTLMLVDALHKVTDGMSQTDFLIKLGISKGASSGRSPGCKAGGNDTRRKVTTSEEALFLIQPTTGELMLLLDDLNTLLDECPSSELNRLQTACLGVSDRIKQVLTSRKKTA
jgi:hypothetical protein